MYGGYAAVTYKQSANDMLCAQEVANGVLINAGAVAAVTPGFGASIGCNNDWKTWWIGSRTQWNVTKDFYMGLDVLYSKISTATGLNTDYFGNLVLPGNIIANSSCTFATRCTTDDVDNWQFRFRVHRDFYP